MKTNTDDLVKKLTDAFLCWRLPKSVCADGCTTRTDWPHDRYGTNLLTAPEAEQMIREVVLPLIAKQPDVETALAALKPVVEYVQAVKNRVPIGIVAFALLAQTELRGDMPQDFGAVEP